MPIGAPGLTPTLLRMTCLELVQRLWEECDKSGAPPSDIGEATGEHRQFFNMILTAWIDIQTAHSNWAFMRRSASWTTFDGQYEYTPLQCGITDGTFSRWIPKTFRVYLTSVGNVGELNMGWVDDYDAWRDTYIINGNRSVRTQPHVAVIGPNQSVFVGPIPAAGYTLTGDYYKAAVKLSQNTERPELPDNHDPMIIVYRAMKSFGRRKMAPEIYDDAVSEYKLRMQRLVMDQLPMVRMAGPLF